MKFLYFDPVMPLLFGDTKAVIGGAAVQWSSWIEGFRANGHEVGLLSYIGANKFIKHKLNFDIIECYDQNYGISNIRLFYYQIPHFLKSIKKYNPDYVIQSSASSHTGVLMIVSKILRIPFIHRVASDVHTDSRLATLIARKEILPYKIGLRYSDYIFVQNGYQLAQLKKMYPHKNIYLLQNPFLLKSTINDILPRNKRAYISWVGNFRKIKNMHALYLIARAMPGICFKIAGKEHKNLDNETKETIHKLSQLKNVEFVGYIKHSEIESFLAQSIVLLNTSFSEGFSNTFLEAWACGVPVVTTKNVNPDNIVSSFILGKVAEDFEQLREAIEKIINFNALYYNELAFRCYNYVKENHDPKRLAQKFVNYLISCKR